jgi:hypothetical protein
MRLPLIPPEKLTAQQKSLYDEMRKGIASNFNAFKVEREVGRGGGREGRPNKNTATGDRTDEPRSSRIWAQAHA